MSATSWLVGKIDVTLVILIMQESSRHSSLSVKLTISSIETSLKLSPRRKIQIIVILVVDISTSIIIVLSSSVVFLEIIGKEIDPVFVLCHLICVVEIRNQLVTVFQVVKVIVGAK